MSKVTQMMSHDVRHEVQKVMTDEAYKFESVSMALIAALFTVVFVKRKFFHLAETEFWG